MFIPEKILNHYESKQKKQRSKLDNRLIYATSAIKQTIANHIQYYPTPINFSYAYSFGSLAGIFLLFKLQQEFFSYALYSTHGFSI